MKVALYAGSFDPFTTGHLFVTRSAAALFDHLIVLVGDNPAKQPTFTASERLRMIRAATRRLPNVRADRTSGLIIDYAREVGATVLVRGIRDTADAQAETTLAEMNRSLAPEIATILLPAPAELRSVSSSAAKALARSGDGLESVLAPEIARQLRQRLGGAS